MASTASQDLGSKIRTSGNTDPVWIATEPYSKLQTFPKLASDIQTELLIVGGGIAGIQLAYEAIQKGLDVTLIEARETLSGESGRTSGHLASALDDHYYELIASEYLPPSLPNTN